MTRGLVLTYHAQRCGGYDYVTNDHYALVHDLRRVHDYGLPIVSLREIARKIASGCFETLPSRFVAFSCDDGTSLDWHDYDHPQFGLQKSFANILRDHLREREIQGDGLMTSFVIASPAARKAIDEGCYGGIALSDDDWWAEAANEGLMAIENHSWDHVHAVLPKQMLPLELAGNFHAIATRTLADDQIRCASEYIDKRLAATGQRTSLFAYPYGHVNEFLARTYLPQYQQEHGVIGAFTTEKQFVDAQTQAYAIPRYVCGDAWQTQEEFEAILQCLVA